MIIGSGAEAIVSQDGDTVHKSRTEKSYRHPALDMQLRKSRTRREAKVLQKLAGIAPALFDMDDSDMVLSLEFIDGAQLRDTLTQDNAREYAQKLGALIKTIHDMGIIHGDLTTSNVLVRDGVLVPIDFGLSFFSDSLEDRAVDLHLLKETSHAKHPTLPLWDAIASSYADKAVLARLEEVEMRGRYKKKGS